MTSQNTLFSACVNPKGDLVLIRKAETGYTVVKTYTTNEEVYGQNILQLTTGGKLQLYNPDTK